MSLDEQIQQCREAIYNGNIQLEHTTNKDQRIYIRSTLKILSTKYKELQQQKICQSQSQ